MKPRSSHTRVVALVLATIVGIGCGTRVTREVPTLGGSTAPAVRGAAGPSALPPEPASAGPATTATAPPTGVALAPTHGRSRGANAGSAKAETGPVEAAAPSGDSVGAPAPSSRSAADRGMAASASPARPTPASTATCPGGQPPLRIASVGTQSGVVGAIFNNGLKAVQAWVAATNAAGGLRCRPVTYVLADDGGDTARHQAAIRKFVEVDRVVAFVHMTALITGAASIDYLNEHRVPVIGTEAASPWVYDSPMYFPQATSGDAQVVAAIATAGDVGRKREVARFGTLTCVEAQACSRVHDLAPQHAPRFGLDVVYRGQGSLAQPDFVANCQAAKSAGAQILFLGFDANSIERIGRSCATVDYHPAFVTAAQAAALHLARNPSLDGLTVEMPVLPWMVTDNRAIREFRAVLERYAAIEPDSPAITGWVSAKLFERAVELAPRGASSRDDLLAGLWAIHNDDLNGLTLPLSFRTQEPAPAAICYWQVVVQAGAYTAADQETRTCL